MRDSQRVGLGALIALTVVTAVVAGAAAWGYLRFRRIERVDVDLERAAPAKPANFLVVGSDTRELGASDSGEAGIYGKGKEIPPSGQRADTIVIARVDPGRSTIEMLSVPRDLWVKLPAKTSPASTRSTPQLPLGSNSRCPCIQVAMSRPASSRAS